MEEEGSSLADFARHEDRTVAVSDDNIKEDLIGVIEDENTTKPGPRKRGRKPKAGKMNNNVGKAAEVTVEEKDMTMADFALERSVPIATVSSGHIMEHIRGVVAVSAMKSSPKKRGRKPKAGKMNNVGKAAEVTVEEKDVTMADFALERSVPVATVSTGHLVEHIRGIEAVSATKSSPKKRGRKPKAKGILNDNGGLESREVLREDENPSMADSASNAGKSDARFFFDCSEQNHFNGIKAGSAAKPLPKKRGRKPKATGMNSNQGRLDLMEVIMPSDPEMVAFASNSGKEAGCNYSEGNHLREVEVESAAKPGPRKRGRKPKVKGTNNDKVGSEEKVQEVLTGKEDPRLADFTFGGQSGIIGLFDYLKENPCSQTETVIASKPSTKKRGRKPKSREMKNGDGDSTGLVIEEVDPNLADLVSNRGKHGVRVSLFDYAVESHFEALRRISSLCKIVEEDIFEASVAKHLSASITFLEQWKDFCYEPKNIRFSYETGGAQGTHYIDGTTLPQFSSVSVPEMVTQSCSSSTLTYSNDFILHVGGPVWALDWCPIAQVVDHHIKCQYLAVAAHPPDCSYHKVGEPLTGRGLIQIWCILTVDDELSVSETPRNGRKRMLRSGYLDVLQPNPILAKDMSRLSIVSDLVVPTKQDAALGVVHGDLEGKSKSEFSVSFQENCLKADTVLRDFTENNYAIIQSNENKEPSNDPKQSKDISVQDEISAINYSVPVDVSLPRLVLGLAHNGRVTWDAKWKPQTVEDSKDKHRMGYLAVLLGNGSLEVWEVPFPNVVKTLYASHKKEGTDPRFVKLLPVFKCSKINRGGHQSIPLTVEWSSSAPHTLLLAGFHDGTVALWKFIASATLEYQDTRPLLCFTADNVPIRALAWGPAERNEDGANLIVTGGHEGLRFWDLRDPYRPLWDLNPIRRAVLSIDWLQDPGCLLLAFDDGTLRILSMCQAVNDTPVSGKPYRGSSQQGLHFYCHSTFPIWSLHMSRHTGVVAYCVADGSALCFQLPRKAVEKDPARHRAQVFLCGSITEEDSILTVNTPMSGSSLTMRKPSCGSKETPRSAQAKITDPQSAATVAPDSEPVIATHESHVASEGKRLSSHSPDETTSDGEIPAKSKMSDGVEKPVKPVAEFETFPSKNVAMHRIRWNTNKGSEKWLCYGGAAGFVRCQELSLKAAQRKR
ncbi:uncharacterized protein [Aristolochia californica]|uniref:uncharacterized protein n=1 Tax=Aristolochia californica TaxID=171875 RepID=UPI0035DC6AEE